MKVVWCALAMVIAFAAVPGGAIVAQCIDIDCPPDTVLTAGDELDPSPLMITNCDAQRGRLSYFLRDSRQWGSHPCVAGFSPVLLQPGSSFDMFGAAYGSYRIHLPADAAHGSSSDVTVIARPFDDPAPRPLLTVTEQSHGSWQFQGMYPVPAEIEIAPGTTVEFSWEGDSGGHGASLAGYRYGWDIGDLFDELDSGWRGLYDPACQSSTPRVFYSGIHHLSILAVDDSGSFTLGVIMVVVVPGTLAEGSAGTARGPYGTPPPATARAYGPMEAVCTFRVTVDNTVGSREETWGGIKALYRGESE